MSHTGIPRRAALSLGGSTILASMLGGQVFAQNTLLSSDDPVCSVIDQILANAAADANDAGPWSLTLDPFAIERLLSGISELKAGLDGVPEVVDKARAMALMAYAEGVGSGLLLIGGVAATAAGAATLGAGILVAGIAFSGSMLIVRAIATPERPGAADVLTNVGGSRLPMVFEAFGDGAVVLSRNAATYGRIAGTVTGLAFTLYSFVQFAQANAEFQRGTAEMQRLRDELASAEAGLAELRDFASLQATRRACAQAVEAEMSAARGGICTRLR